MDKIEEILISLVDKSLDNVRNPNLTREIIRNQIVQAHRQIIEAVGEMVDAEPELPGEMPNEMFALLRNDKDAIVNALRIAVKQTKDNIKAKLERK